MNIWESGYDLFKHSSLQNIIFGMGKYSFYTISAHNDILRVLFANGIIGLIVYLALLGKAGFLVVKRFVRGRSPFALLGVLTFIALIIDSIGTMPTMYPGYQWFAWGVLGLALAPDAEATPADQHHEQKN